VKSICTYLCNRKRLPFKDFKDVGRCVASEVWRNATRSVIQLCSTNSTLPTEQRPTNWTKRPQSDLVYVVPSTTLL